jgi:beta-mannosidase
LKSLNIALAGLLVAAILSNARADNGGKSSAMKQQLTSNWEFSEAGQDSWHPASVPGCVHTDLIDNKLIPDPYYGTNEKDLQWIGKKDWIYRTTFDVSPGVFSRANVELVFKGLDTYADVYLNGSMILSADNMFRTWRVPVKSILKEAGNKLVIRFRNVFDVDMPKLESAPFRLLDQPNNDQSDTMLAMYSRKAQFEFGWDWGPRLITCGIWKDVYLEAWDNFRLDNVQIIQSGVSEASANIKAVFNITADRNTVADLKVTVDGREYARRNVALVPGKNSADLAFVMDKPDLWWTNGLGAHFLYDFNCEAVGTAGVTAAKDYKIGIRSIEVVRQKDSYGTSFYVKLNGVPVFMKGANYIPQDNFLNRVTPERYEYMIKSAAAAHINMLRVWGGGIYEKNEFYDLCDSNGILVWQEFMFACAMYPSDPAFLDNVREEAIQNVTRLRNHACIALYCGNNENVVGWYQWGQKQQYPEDVQRKFEADMHELYQALLPGVVKEYDPGKYYHYTSPSAGFNGVSPSDGDIHYWGVWHGHEPFSSFDTNIARFVSEYGFQSYPQMSTIEKFAAPHDMQLHSAVMLSHQRCMADNRKDKEYGNRLIQAYMERHYRQPKDFASYVYVSQVLQAEGDKVAMEAHRRNMPFCMGSMYWQIDDCWPVASWSSIDYYGNWKALHYYVAREYRTFLISQVLKDDSIEFYIVSDSLRPADARLDIKVVDFGGRLISSRSFPVKVDPDSSRLYAKVEVNDLVRGADESKIVLISRLVEGERLLADNSYLFRQPKDLDLKKPGITVTASRNGEGYELSFISDTFAKDVRLSLDNRRGFFTDNYFDLVPGETKTLEFITKEEISDAVKDLKVMSLVDSY